MDDSLLYRSVHLPRVVRVGERAIRELADDSLRLSITRAVIVWSAGLPPDVSRWVRDVLSQGGVEGFCQREVSAGTDTESREILAAAEIAERHTSSGDGEVLGAEDTHRWGRAKGTGIIAVGGGRALDVGKYAAHLAGVPFISVPTSLSHDGFASPSASLVVMGPGGGKRQSLPCDGPAGVIVDTQICAAAPRSLFAAGAGDVMAKVTALSDWQLAEHAGQLKVDGIAAAIAESAISSFEAHPHPDPEGVARLARSLLLGGVAIAIAGSSRPCSGAEHLISHALDRLRPTPGSHGIQVGLAAYLLSQIQSPPTPPPPKKKDTPQPTATTTPPTVTPATTRIATALTPAGLFQAAHQEQIPLPLFEQAVHLAPSIKPGYLTVLSRPNAIDELLRLAHSDPRLKGVWA